MALMYFVIVNVVNNCKALSASMRRGSIISSSNSSSNSSSSSRRRRRRNRRMRMRSSSSSSSSSYCAPTCSAPVVTRVLVCLHASFTAWGRSDKSFMTSRLLTGRLMGAGAAAISLLAVQVQRCLTSIDTTRTIRDGKPTTAISTAPDL